MTNTLTTSSTFTRTHAKHIGSKIAADLAALLSYYGRPSESDIRDFYEELVELLSGGYLQSVEYGFRRDGRRIFAVFYEVRQDGSLDQYSGGIPSRLDLGGAEWFSYLIPNKRWHSLSSEDRKQIEDRIPVKRVLGSEPLDGDGVWEISKSYAAGGVSTQRRVFRPSGGRA